MSKPPGLYANIDAKRKRIAGGSKETMRKPGSKGAPTAAAFTAAAKTAKPVKKASAGGAISGANGMMKKKGYAKGGAAKRGAVKRANGGAMMKKKGYAKGGLAKMKRGGAARKK
jgi:hypothetical protein|tara:strand:+ start:545 stop:886 length:342 start_codon:yes stop_codon:yes gene_type:complete